MKVINIRDSAGTVTLGSTEAVWLPELLALVN